MRIDRPVRRIVIVTFFFLSLTSLSALDHAERLEIIACDHATIIEVRDGRAGFPTRSYALVGHDDPPIDDGSYDAVIEVPVRRIAVLSSSVLTYFDDLDLLGALVAVDSRETIYNDAILSRIADGLLLEVGGGPSIDRERIVAARPDLVLYSPVGPDDATLAALHAAGIPVVHLADWREPTPLARLEWLRLIGALFDRSQRAEQIVDERTRRYEQLRALTNAVTDGRRPHVLVNAPWRGQWPVPPADSYIARFIADAGGHYLWNDLEAAGTQFLDLESVIARAVRAEVWINLNAGWNTPEEIVAEDPRLAAFPPFRSEAVYHYDARERDSGANDFWESGAAHPEIVLADLITIFHPGQLPDHQLYYYRNIFR